jgi:cyclophilin family peptidyl-prolyl cis-trans isomerase
MANRSVKIETNKGVIDADLFVDETPITAGNFIDLVEKGFYDGLGFHRFEPGFVIQGGCPRGNGTGGYIDPETGKERRIKLEVKKELKHDSAGVLAMARSADPNSASCQFYITLAPAGFLDMNYAVFGRVTTGLETVQELRAGDKIKKITVDPV